jgi:hypothetical protein
MKDDLKNKRLVFGDINNWDDKNDARALGVLSGFAHF